MAVSVVRSRSHNGFQQDPHTDTVDCTGADALLVVVGSASGVPSGVTYNGVSMTELWNSGDSGVAACACYMLLAPTTGSNTVSVDFTGLTDSAILSIVLSGVEQSSIGASHRTVSSGAGGGSGQPTRTATTVSGDFVFAAVTNNAATVNTGQTLIVRAQNVFGNGFSVGAESDTATGVSTVMTFSAAAGGTFWYEGAVAIVAAAGGSVPTIDTWLGRQEIPPRAKTAVVASGMIGIKA